MVLEHGHMHLHQSQREREVNVSESTAGTPAGGAETERKEVTTECETQQADQQVAHN